jgi:putative CocE/NonD family hydrolase
LPSWPPPAWETRYFLQPHAGLSQHEPPVRAAPDHYRYDPADPTPSVGGTLLLTGGPRDNRQLEARPDVLCFTTAPLDADLEVIGLVSLELYVCSSLEHTDFAGRLCDVHPDGRSINICDGLLRLNPGTDGVQPDGSRRIRIDLWATAHRFRRRHRLRLQVSSGAHPRWSRNPGTGEPIGTATSMVAADQTIYHDGAHPSALVPPVTGQYY